MPRHNLIISSLLIISTLLLSSVLPRPGTAGTEPQAIQALGPESFIDPSTTGEADVPLFAATLNRHGQTTFAPDQLVVKFSSGTYPTIGSRGFIATGHVSLDALLGEYQVLSATPLFPGLQLKGCEGKRAPIDFGLPRVYRLHLPAGSDVLAIAQALSTDSNVEYAEPDYLAQAAFIPNDPHYSDQWGLPQIQTDLAWDMTQGSPAVAIAIVDTGIDLDHPDLSTELWINPGEIPGNGQDDDGNGYIDDVNGWDWVNNDNEPQDDIGHGSHVAGTAAAATDNGIGVAGVCPNCRLMALKVLDAAGQGTYSDIAQGITYAADKGAKVINLSLGGYADAQLLRDAVAYTAQSSVVVAAAGNDNKQDFFYPAAYNDYVVAVVATDNNDQKAAFSNYGDWIDLSAPGVSIWSTLYDDTYAAWSGSSMAAPFVAGVAGLVHSQHLDWSAGTVRGQLLHTADDIDTLNPGYEGKLGRGRVNAFQALTLTAHPELNVKNYAVNGVPYGHPDPGSLLTMTVALRNTWRDAPGVIALVSSTDPYVTLTHAVVTYGNIIGYDTVTNTADPFELAVSAAAPPGHLVTLPLFLSDTNGYTMETALVLEVLRTETVEGMIGNDTVWESGRVYHVVNHVWVPAGVTLTVEAGASVEVDPAKHIQVDGTLRVLGTITEPVYFQMVQGDRWQTIQLTDDSVDACYGVEGDYLSGSIVQGAVIEGAEIGLTIGDASPHVEGNTIRDCGSGVFSQGWPRILGNTVAGNDGDGIFGTAGEVRGNLVFANGGDGISGNADAIQNNVVRANLGRGITGAPWLVQGNLVQGNEAGGISGSPGQVLDNNIWGNGAEGLLLNTPSGGVMNNSVSGNVVGSWTEVVESIGGPVLPAMAYSSDSEEYLIVGGEEWFGIDGIYGQRVLTAGASIREKVAIAREKGAQGWASVAYSPEAAVFLVVWGDTRNGGIDVYGQRVLTDGTLIGDEIAVCTTASPQLYPSVVYGSGAGEFLVLWADSQSDLNDIYGQRVSLDGSLIGGEFPVCNFANEQWNPAAAYSPEAEEFLVVWEDRRTDVGDIYSQLVLTDGTLLGTEIAICTATQGQSNATVAYSPEVEEFLVVWMEGSKIYGRRVSTEGTLLGNEIVISPPEAALFPWAAYSSEAEEFLVVWQEYRSDYGGIYGQRVLTDGTLAGEIAIFTSTELPYPEYPVVDYSPEAEEFLVIWYWAASSESGSHGQRVSTNGDLVGPRFRIQPELFLAHNTVVENGTGLYFSYSEGSRLSVHENNLCLNPQYALELAEDTDDLTATLNFWGTTEPAEIDAFIYDCNDDPPFYCISSTFGLVAYTPFLSESVQAAPPYVMAIETDPSSPLPLGVFTLTLDFSKPMSPSIQPTVTFGISPTNDTHAITGDWIHSTQWAGTYEITFYTGDGLNLLYVAGAVSDDDKREIPPSASFTFEIGAIGAVNINAEPGYRYIVLSWPSSGMGTTAGYNVYRSTQGGGPYTRTNETLITTTAYTDTDVINGVAYYYVVKLVSTDLVELDYGDEVAATPGDYTAPSTPVVTDDGSCTPYTDRLHASWWASDPESGILEYQYSIGTTSGGAEVINWTSAATATEVTHFGLSLLEGVTYYLNVKARNGMGAWSQVGSSDGILVHGGCPEVDFTADPRSGDRPLTVQFTDHSTGTILAYHWAFGDGSTSTFTNPVHSYTTTGVFTVTLTATGTVMSNSRVKPAYITVLEAPLLAGFTAIPTSGLVPLTVVFTDTSSGQADTWQWSFGDGISSTLPHPTHTYTAAGVYTVSLAVNGPGGADALIRANYITVNELGEQFRIYIPLILRAYLQPATGAQIPLWSCLPNMRCITREEEQ